MAGLPVAGLFTGSGSGSASGGTSTSSAAAVVTASGGVAFQGRPPSGSW